MLNESDVVVYVERGYCAFNRLEACLLHHVVVRPNARYLRILVRPQTAPQRIAEMTAHELAHAVEISRAPRVVDGDAFRDLYRQIGFRCGLGIDCYETEAAVTAAIAVASELRASEVTRQQRRADNPH